MKLPFRPFIILSALAASLLLNSCFCFTIIDALGEARNDAVAAQVVDRIHLSMDIDEAIDILRKDGFKVRNKEEWDTMYRTCVDLDGGGIPWHWTLRYVVGISVNQNPHLWIIASSDGRIVRIRRH